MTASLKVQKVTSTDWYYEYPTHLCLVHEIKSREGVHIRTDIIKIPWKQIEVSIKRTYRKRRKAEGKP